MDLFKLTKSKTRQKILGLFLSHPNKDYYLRALEKELSISAGNIRREFISLIKTGLFQRYKKGRLIYYKIDIKSAPFKAIKMLMDKNDSIATDIISEGFSWITKLSPIRVSAELYSPTRDLFQVRLDSYGRHLEERLGTDAYLITAIAGEIGNNSFDHNLGNWRNIPGVYFAHNDDKKIIILADRGQGILKTISRIVPDVKADKEALHIAFTQVISGRSPERRGNGLKFVVQIIKDKKWNLQFYSGCAVFTINAQGLMRITETKRNIKGCFAVIKYGKE